MRVYEAIRAGDDQLVAVVAVEVGEHRRGLAVPGGDPGGDRSPSDRFGEAGQHALVALQVGGPAIVTGEGRSAVGRADDESDGERVGCGVRPAVVVGWAGLLLGSVEAGARWEARLQLADRDLAEGPRMVRRVAGVAVAPAVAERREVAGWVMGRARVVGVLAGSHQDLADVAGPAREHLALNIERRVCGTHLFVPLG